MMKNPKFYLLLAIMLFVNHLAQAQVVIEDEGVSISKEELAYLVQHWTPPMQQAAASDHGDRLELLNMELAGKKIVAEADKISLQENPEEYWELQFLLRNVKRRFIVSRFMDEMTIPDMSDLAKERYLTDKDTYALVPELRSTSHILIRCVPPECGRKEKRPQIESIMKEVELGSDFSALAKNYSEDPGSKDNGGKFDKWLGFADTAVDPHYLQATFAIEGVGENSGIIESQFGFHIIRLDEIREQHYRPYEEVKIQIIDALEREYKKLAAKGYDAKYRISDKVVIDGKAMDEIFSKYKTAE